MLYNLYSDPDGQDYLGVLQADTAREAEAEGARIFGAPVIAVSPDDPMPHRLPFQAPFRAPEEDP